MHVDVLIVGAGLSGIGSACHLSMECPDRTFALLEGRSDLGGTWDLFRYPGIRSDSDMHTLGYAFRPWTDAKAIADGPSILSYIRETAEAYDVTRHIRFGHRVVRASWSSAQRHWRVEAEHDGETVQMTCQFLFMCSGYYRYASGYTPTFPGRGRFTGPVLHPQQWPEELSVEGKRVVVIGSGATAVTLAPALADRGAQVTMLQRSPTYVVALPSHDAIGDRLRRWLPEKAAYRLTRAKNVRYADFVNRFGRRFPERMKRRLRALAQEHLDDATLDAHFTPTYAPGTQRICLAPDGDLFAAIREGRVKVVTDTIRTFTETGIALDDGAELPADLIVTATGLDLLMLGGAQFDVDGTLVDFGSTWAYKGMSYSDVPNLASTFGYVNASWTLRADLIAHYVCRLLNHMKATGTTVCTPRLRPTDHDMEAKPFVTDFNPGYMQRAIARFPQQGDRDPWTNIQSYRRDKGIFRKQPVDDGVMQFS